MKKLLIILFLVVNIFALEQKFVEPEVAFKTSLKKIGDDIYFESIKDLEVSSHFLIKRTGEVIQFVSCNDRAWHAGISLYKGRENCNDFSIGIELQGTEDIKYSAEQYQSLVSLTQVIQNAYPSIQNEDIVGHEFISPGRKSDPGKSFNWDSYKKSIL